nr:hypothetical protein Iba_chr06cCG0370 [Ipomoea batatas]
MVLLVLVNIPTAIPSLADSPEKQVAERAPIILAENARIMAKITRKILMSVAIIPIFVLSPQTTKKTGMKTPITKSSSLSRIAASTTCDGIISPKRNAPIIGCVPIASREKNPGREVVDRGRGQRDLARLALEESLPVQDSGESGEPRDGERAAGEYEAGHPPVVVRQGIVQGCADEEGDDDAGERDGFGLGADAQEWF